MKILAAERACGILFRFLKAHNYEKPFLVPSNVCYVIPMTFLSAGVPFEFIDINKDTLCCDEDSCLNLLATLDYSGLLFVRTYGGYYDTANFFCKIKRISEEIAIIDDRCLCRPSLCYMGNGSDIQLYSTGYSKYVELNRGAYAFIDNDNTYTKMLSIDNICFNNFLDIDEYVIKNIELRHKIKTAPEGWLNTSLFEEEETKQYFQSIVDKLKDIDIHKNEINKIYTKYLEKDALINASYRQWRYSIIVNRKNEILDSIFSKSLFASSHYYPANRIFESSANTPNAQWLFDHVINLFNDYHFSVNKAEAICQIINKHLSCYGDIKKDGHYCI